MIVPKTKFVVAFCVPIGDEASYERSDWRPKRTNQSNPRSLQPIESFWYVCCLFDQDEGTKENDNEIMKTTRMTRGDRSKQQDSTHGSMKRDCCRVFISTYVWDSSIDKRGSCWINSVVVVVCSNNVWKWRLFVCWLIAVQSMACRESISLFQRGSVKVLPLFGRLGCSNQWMYTKLNVFIKLIWIFARLHWPDIFCSFSFLGSFQKAEAKRRWTWLPLATAISDLIIGCYCVNRKLIAQSMSFLDVCSINPWRIYLLELAAFMQMCCLESYEY